MLGTTHSKKIEFFLLLFPFFSLLATPRSFETTRLKSTAGTGVGSLLVEESTILNPAPISFFKVTSFYVQTTDGNLGLNNVNDPSQRIDESQREDLEDMDHLGIIASDSKGPVAGSLSFFKQTEQFNKRMQFSSSLASKIGGKSAFGTTFRYTIDQLKASPNDEVKKEKYKQFIFGVTHAISNELSVGLVAVDPFKEKEEETRAILGAQYTYDGFISVMADAGADYNRDLSETILYRFALQFRVFKDFFLRAGMYKDKGLQETGNGVGLAWVQPKLQFEFGLKNSKRTNNTLTSSSDFNKLRETSFSVSYHF